jgi:hypothetical protein
MSQPPVSPSGQGQQPGPDRRLSTDSGSDGPLRLADFADGGPGNTCLPGPELAAALDALSGPDQRCPGADDDQLIGLLGRWQALEAWAAAAKLGVARELIRRRADHPCRHPAPGDLPHRWDHGTGHEVAAALALSLPAADNLTDLSWTLRARLPATAAALAAGIIDYTKATIIVRELAVLDDEHAALAEALIAGQLAGKTAGQPSAPATDPDPKTATAAGP